MSTPPSMFETCVNLLRSHELGEKRHQDGYVRIALVRLLSDYKDMRLRFADQQRERIGSYPSCEAFEAGLQEMEDAEEKLRRAYEAFLVDPTRNRDQLLPALNDCSHVCESHPPSLPYSDTITDAKL